MRRKSILLIYGVQALLLFALYYGNELYHNNLGFMRNYSYYTHKISSSVVDSIIDLLAVLITMVVLFLFYHNWKKSQTKIVYFSSIVLLTLSVIFVYWQFFQSPVSNPVYYLVSIVLCLSICTQILIIILYKK